MKVWSELETGDNLVMRGSDERILLLEHNVFKLVRMSRRRDQDIKLTVTGTIASKVMVSAVTKGERREVVSIHEFL